MHLCRFPYLQFSHPRIHLLSHPSRARLPAHKTHTHTSTEVSVTLHWKTWNQTDCLFVKICPETAFLSHEFEPWLTQKPTWSKGRKARNLWNPSKAWTQLYLCWNLLSPMKLSQWEDQLEEVKSISVSDLSSIQLWLTLTWKFVPLTNKLSADLQLISCVASPFNKKKKKTLLSEYKVFENNGF